MIRNRIKLLASNGIELLTPFNVNKLKLSEFNKNILLRSQRLSSTT